METFLDTDILSAILRRHDQAIVRARGYLSHHSCFTLSAITRYEVLRGLKAKRAEKQLLAFEEFCAGNKVLMITDKVIVKASEIYALLHQQGKLIGDADILIGATAFGLVFRGMGGASLVSELMLNLPGGTWGFMAVSMGLIFALGFFLDFLQICFIVVPILQPIAQQLNIDLLWLAVLIGINLQTSFLTPPFGFSLFYLKAVAPPEIKIQHIYKGILPFVVIQVIVIILLLVFPETVLWLPNLMDKWQGL